MYQVLYQLLLNGEVRLAADLLNRFDQFRLAEMVINAAGSDLQKRELYRVVETARPSPALPEPALKCLKLIAGCGTIADASPLQAINAYFHWFCTHTDTLQSAISKLEEPSLL